MSAKDLLLSAVTKKTTTPVEFPDRPDLDGKIFVRVLSAAEKHLYTSVQLDANSEGGRISEYEIVAICACEEDGTPLFHKRDESGRIVISEEEVRKLSDVDCVVVQAIYAKALSVSGILDRDQLQALKKSFEAIRSDDSSSV